MDEYNSVHLADASLDLFAWIVNPAIEKTFSDGALVAGIYSQNALCLKLLASFLSLITNFKNSSSAMIIINLICSIDVMYGHVTWLDFCQ